MQTILITGCSSGYGLQTARHFLANDWNVIATMRTPRENILPRSDLLRILPLEHHERGEHRRGSRSRRADRCPREQCGDRRRRRL